MSDGKVSRRALDGMTSILIRHPSKRAFASRSDTMSEIRCSNGLRGTFFQQLTIIRMSASDSKVRRLPQGIFCFHDHSYERDSLCRAGDPVTLNLKTGVLPDKELEFEEVPLIRFRKAFVPIIPAALPADVQARRLIR